MRGPLNGVRILDTTRLLPGPYATWLLAGMGADVVKVEHPTRGDYIRWNWPRRHGTSTVFHLYNQGKRSVALDLKKPEGRAAFLDLVVTADVVVDGNRPGVLDRLGCGFAVCRGLQPTLVWCAITGFGQSGPYASRVGHDVNYLSLAGALDGLRSPDGTPIAPRVTIADMAGGGLMGAFAIAAALVGARTSEGGARFVDVSMTDSVVSMQGLRLAEELVPGDAPPVASDDSEEWVPEDNDWEFGVYETADGEFVSLDPYERRFKEELWRVLEEEGCGRRPPRRAGREATRKELAHAIRQRTRARWVELLSDREVCFAPVYSVGDLAADPHIMARGLLGNAMNPGVASPSLGLPFVLDPPVAPLTGAAPRLGEHTREILGEIGWDEGRLSAAEARGAIGCASGRREGP